MAKFIHIDMMAQLSCKLPALDVTERPRYPIRVRLIRLPERLLTQACNLMTYGPVLSDVYRRLATHVDRIRKGAKPGDLPVELPTRLEFVINAKTANALGMAIPPDMLVRADVVIR